MFSYAWDVPMAGKVNGRRLLLRYLAFDVVVLLVGLGLAAIGFIAVRTALLCALAAFVPTIGHALAVGVESIQTMRQRRR